MDNPYQKLNDLGFSSDLKDYTFKELLRLDHLLLSSETHIPHPPMIDRGVYYARNWRRRGISVMLPETHPHIHPFYSKTPSPAVSRPSAPRSFSEVDREADAEPSRKF